MTDSDVKTEKWAPFHDAKHYEADALSGNVRSLPRGRYPGTYPDPMKRRRDPDGYLRINYTDDNGVRHHNASVARLVLMAHDPDGYFPGAVACHQPGRRRDDCRLVALRWDTEEANRKEALGVRLENSPPKPKPAKTCPRCGAQHRDKGRNCHPCVMQIGVQAAGYLAEGSPLDKVAEALDYSPVGVFTLAKRYGGLRCIIDVHQAVSLSTGQGKSAVAREVAAALSHPASPKPWLRRVINRARAFRRNSDAG